MPDISCEIETDTEQIINVEQYLVRNCPAAAATDVSRGSQQECSNIKLNTHRRAQ